MVESQDQIAEGIQSGGFEENDFVNVANMTFRICAPSNTNKNTSSAILWTKSHNNDKLEWSKVVHIYLHFIVLPYSDNFFRLGDLSIISISWIQETQYFRQMQVR